jgi:phosphoheptose isomerase
VYILSAGGAHVNSSENNSSILIASENFRDESCICITMFGKENGVCMLILFSQVNKEIHVNSHIRNFVTSLHNDKELRHKD